MTKIKRWLPFWSTWSRFLLVVNVLAQFTSLKPFYMYFAYVTGFDMDLYACVSFDINRRQFLLIFDSSFLYV